MSTILITGGSGLIGTALVPKLLDAGHQVRIIGRKAKRSSIVPSFEWDLRAMTMDVAALDGVTHIIHLAGAGIADERWTLGRKQEILESRVMPLKLLADELRRQDQRLEAIISASGIGYYGAVTSDNIFEEDDAPADDFLGRTCQLWEEAISLFDGIATREVRVRTGIVLDTNGGALPKLMMPARYGLAATLGSGRQWMPWLHVDDLCRIYQWAVENTTMAGAYNAVALEHVTQRQLLAEISSIARKPFFLPGVPVALARMALGEMSVMLTEGSRVSGQRLTDLGFEFIHPGLRGALKDLLV